MDISPQLVELGQQGAIISWTEPFAIDMSGTVSRISRSHQPGSFFTLGATTVNYTFSDSAGNTASCVFCVQVLDGKYCNFRISHF